MTPTSLRLVVPLHFGVGEKKKKTFTSWANWNSQLLKR